MGAEAVPQDDGMGNKAWSYFIAMSPMLLSLGLGGTALGAVYAMLNYIWSKIQRLLYCSIVLKYDDDTFHWVNKYLRDNGHIKGDGTLKCRKK